MVTRCGGMDGDNAGYLVLVDGVPRDANNVMPSEIAQISFLKGAMLWSFMVVKQPKVQL